MPELPEVETIRGELDKVLIGQKIEGLWWRKNSRVFRDFLHKDRFARLIKDQKVIKITRRGKYLLIELSKGLTLVIHLGMTGNLLLRKKSLPPDQHTHLELYFKNFKLSFRDPRTFGRVAVFKLGWNCKLGGLARLGPEPLSREFNEHWLWGKISGRNARIKSILMDQSICAGVGNIYSDEACFLAGVSPLRRAGNLEKQEIKKLVKALKRVLKKAIQNMGTTFRDYRTSFEKRGDYQPLVYARAGELCPRCESKIRRVRIGNRSSYYCPKCQR